MKKVCKCCGQDRLMLPWETVCCQCNEKKEIIAAKAAIAKGEEPETASIRWVICPYCGNGQDTSDGYTDFPEIYTEGEYDIECPDCGETFRLETWISRSYETRKIPKG